jgi:hypothetical protein
MRWILLLDSGWTAADWELVDTDEEECGLLTDAEGGGDNQFVVRRLKFMSSTNGPEKKNPPASRPNPLTQRKKEK